MAAVTQNSTPIENVNGAIRESYYNLTVVTTGDTLAVNGYTAVYEMTSNKTSITAMTYSAGVVTFTGTGSNILFCIRGH